jgi:hypothetical protein
LRRYTLDPGADAEVNLRTLHGVARDFKRWYGEPVDRVAVGRQRATCAVSGIGWRLKMQVELCEHQVRRCRLTLSNPS